MSSIYLLSFIITFFYLLALNFPPFTHQHKCLDVQHFLTLYVHLCVEDFVATAISFSV